MPSFTAPVPVWSSEKAAFVSSAGAACSVGEIRGASLVNILSKLLKGNEQLGGWHSLPTEHLAHLVSSAALISGINGAGICKASSFSKSI